MFTVRDGKAVEYRIAPGREIDGWVEVAELKGGEMVAVSNVPMLVNNAPVRAVGGAQ
jgi:hypothetical protein